MTRNRMKTRKDFMDPSVAGGTNRSPCCSLGVEDQTENGAGRSLQNCRKCEDDATNSSMVGRATASRSSSNASDHIPFSPAFQDSEAVKGAAHDEEIKGNDYDNRGYEYNSSGEEKGDEDGTFRRSYMNYEEEEDSYFRLHEAKNVRQSSRNKGCHSSSFESGYIEESKTGKDARGRGSCKGEYWGKRECGRAKGKTKAKSNAKSMSNRRKSEDDNYFMGVIGGRDSIDDEGPIREKIKRSRSTTSMGLRKASTHSDAVSAKKKVAKERTEAIRKKGRGSIDGMVHEERWGPCPYSVKQNSESSSGHEQGAGKSNSPSLPSSGYADAILHERIRKQDKRPLDEHVRKARMILARALRSEGKSVRLPGLCLRYPQNITALLDDAAQALEHGLRVFNARKDPRIADLKKWSISWGQELEVVDLSRNKLDGIEPLLMVKPHSPELVPEEKACTPQGSCFVYPLSGVIELWLNGNNLRQLPPDMHLALPKLERLELYGNIIEDIRLPKAQLPHLKHLNLGNNKLLDLPAEICTVMPNLEVLLLSLNDLVLLPNEIAGMRHLKRLDVSQNPLTFPPLEVAARGVDAVKRYFRDIEAQDRADGHVKVPNQLKVIFLGHRDAGKSMLVERLSTPTPPGVAETQEGPCKRPYGTPVAGCDVYPQPVNTRVSRELSYRDIALGLGATRSLANTPPSMTARPAGGAASESAAGARLRHEGQQASPPADTIEDIDMDIWTWRASPTLTIRRRSSERTIDWDARKAAGETPSMSGGSGGKDDITLKLWDFGGTEEFHVVHGLFFSRRALYTVVFDLHHVESDIIDKRVQFWIDCIQTRVPGARILLVGTHADQMDDAVAKERCEQVLEQILNNEKVIVKGLKSGGKGSQSARELSHPNSRPKIVDKVLAVTISPDNVQGLQAFREQVLELARDGKDFPTSRLPPAWFEIDSLVKQRRSQEQSIMGVDELVEALKSKSPEDTRNTVVSTLNWLNDTSEVVYFSKPQLDHFVILHPLHLMKVIKLIVSLDLKDEVKNLIMKHNLEKQDRNCEISTSNAVIAPPPPNASVSSNTSVRRDSFKSSASPKSMKSSGGSLPALARAPEADDGNGGGSGRGISIRKPRRNNRGKKRGPSSQESATKTTSALNDCSAEGVSTSGGGSGGFGGGFSEPTRDQRGGRRRGRGGRGRGLVKGVTSNASPLPSISSQPQKSCIDDQKQQQQQQQQQQRRVGKGSTSRTRTVGGAAAARATADSGERRAIARHNLLTDGDEINVNNGFVRHAVVNALLKPLEEMRWDDSARNFLIRLLQESCVLVEVDAKTPKGAASRRGFMGDLGRDGDKDKLPPTIPSSRPSNTGTMSRSSSKGNTSDKEGEQFYFIPCNLPKLLPNWRFDRVSRVYCGRRWTFQRFVPPSLMSVLICRFYEMGIKGSAKLCRGSITIKVRLPSPSKGNDKQKSQDRSAIVELLLRMFPGQHAPQDSFRYREPSRLELWAQVKSGHQKQLMQSLESFVQVVDNTLAEFPGLLVFRRVPCPACMERKPTGSALWGDLPLEEVERYRSSLPDLPSCANNCVLRDSQKRLMFVGELPPGTGATDGQIWDSPLPELGSGVPRVDSLYRAVCPIAVYDCLEQRVVSQATAFVVDAEKGYLLTAAHTFGTVKSPRDGKPFWEIHEKCPKASCIILVAMLQPPFQYDTKWEFVAEAVQHSSMLREKMYDEICWNKDHPVLLRMKRRFQPVSTRVTSNLPFTGITEDWNRPSVKDASCPDDHQEPGLTALNLGESRMFHRPWEGSDYLTVYPKALLDVLQSLGVMNGKGDEDVQMSMSVFPQELLILIAFPEHLWPHYSSICVTHGPVARNLVAQDVIEVLLSNNPGASGGPVVDKKGQVVGILSQGNSVSAYVMGISTAKTIMRAEQSELEDIYNLDPLLRMLNWQAQKARLGAL